jgi:hypothetical protein
VDRWQALRRTNFSETNLFGLIDRLADEVREAQPREAARWGLEPRGGSYQSEIDWMKQWLSERIDFIDRQLVQPPALSQGGGRVASGFQLTLTGPAGATIYYPGRFGSTFDARRHFIQRCDLFGPDHP